MCFPDNQPDQRLITMNTNVVPIRAGIVTRQPARDAQAFANPDRGLEALTYKLVMAQHRAGTLNPAVVEYMLAGIGLEP